MNIKSKTLFTLLKYIDNEFVEHEKMQIKKSEDLLALQYKYNVICRQRDTNNAVLKQRITKAVGGDFTLDTVSALLLKKILEIKTKDQIDQFIYKLIEGQANG